MEIIDEVSFRSTRSKLRLLSVSVFVGFMTLILLTLAVGGWAWRQYGTTIVAGPLLRGQMLVMEPANFEVGTIPSGEERFLEFRIFNLTGQPIEIYGFGAYCGRDGCVSSDFEYPASLPARGTIELPIRYSGPKDRNDSFRLTATIYTAVGERIVEITGHSEFVEPNFPFPETF